MGNCNKRGDGLSNEDRVSRFGKDRNRKLDQALQYDHMKHDNVHKLLLLGAGESGKSTLFKQIINIYGKGFTEQERKAFVCVVHSNIILSMKALCEASDTFGPVSAKLQKTRMLVDELKGDEAVDQVLGGHLRRLWRDKGIRSTFDNRARFQLPDSASYFFDRLDEIMDPAYVPSQQDVLRCRVRTTGIVEHEFVIDGSPFTITDIGGQRNERKKWMHCFEGVTAILFVVALSEYDQVLYEDENMNRMHEALNIFEEIVNMKRFQNTSVILLLNKRDLFEEKIERTKLTVCFPDFKGPHTLEAGCQYIEQQFTSRNRQPDKKIYVHVTCATDTDNVLHVFTDVKNIVIQNALRLHGMM